MRLTPGLSSTEYVFDPLQGALALGGDSPAGPNIGSDGRNLTISFLSCNRSVLSIKLLHSLETHCAGFRGEVLILDNGSSAEELAHLREAATNSPLSVRIVALEKNYGVAGGRNRAIEACTTEWVMCLDNDIYFLRDPLPSIQRDIALLGCHFLNLPLLQPDKKTVFALGGHLYVSAGANGVMVGGGATSTTAPEPGRDEPFLSTFLFGGAAVLNRASFRRTGGFDEGMFVGFEDVEFSLRLFREGMKIGNTRTMSAVHDHPAPSNAADVDYERKRFAQQRLKDSARYFEAKHGIQAWGDEVERWLEERHRQLDLDSGATPSPVAVQAPLARKPKVALVVDVHGWAFANNAAQLTRHLGDQFELRTIPRDEVRNAFELLLATADCDLVHFFWREHLHSMTVPHLREIASEYSTDPDGLLNRLLDKRRLTTAVYDHLFLGKPEAVLRQPMFARAAAYYVCSRRLDGIYRRTEGYEAPLAVLEDGVDTQLFAPRNLERFQSGGRRRPLVVGWAGNSGWGAERGDPKGFHTILKPALDALAAEGHEFELHFADRAVRKIPHEEMPEYYAKLDVLVCTSKIEGTPNPVLEAMASGVPVISTDVGVVRDALGPQQQQFILKERSTECLKEQLLRLDENRDLLLALSEENLRLVKAWDWSEKAKGFASFFHQVLAAQKS